MKMKPVDSIPKPEGRRYHRLQDFLEEFMNFDAKIVMVEFEENEYKNTKSAKDALQQAVKRSKYSIAVARRKDKIFLMKI